MCPEREGREFSLRELELHNARLQAERSPRQSVSTDPFFDVSRKGRERVQPKGVRAT